MLCWYLTVLVADAGALPEAAAEAAAAVLPVDLVQFPAIASLASQHSSNHLQQQLQEQQQLDAAGSCDAPECSDRVQSWQAGQRSWHGGVYPQVQQQCVDIWAAALQQLLSSRSVYMQHSRRAKAAAEQVVLQAAPGRLQELVDWLGRA